MGGGNGSRVQVGMELYLFVKGNLDPFVFLSTYSRLFSHMLHLWQIRLARHHMCLNTWLKVCFISHIQSIVHRQHRIKYNFDLEGSIWFLSVLRGILKFRMKWSSAEQPVVWVNKGRKGFGRCRDFSMNCNFSLLKEISEIAHDR